MKKRKLSGIYKIEDVKTGNVYVGSADSKNGIKKRWSNHLSNLRHNKYSYEEFQRAWNDDENRIKFEILEQCDDSELQERENYYIDYCERVGWTVLNKQKNAVRKSKVADVTNMQLAQQGQGNGNSRLTEKQAIEIIELKKNKIKHKELALKFGVSASQISKIGKSKWGHLA